ncbi:MAG: hypothetical protein AAF738_03570 [Bacteroidota bacterium]
MKKLLLTLLVGVGALTFGMAQQTTMDAPGTKKSCSKKCTKTCSKTSAAAAKLAALDENIEAKTCPKSGAVSYYRNSTCPVTGQSHSTPVEYSASSKTFVNTSPSAVHEHSKDKHDHGHEHGTHSHSHDKVQEAAPKVKMVSTKENQ